MFTGNQAPEDRGGSERLRRRRCVSFGDRREAGRGGGTGHNAGIGVIFVEVASVVPASLFLQAHQCGSLSPDDIMIGRRRHCTHTGLTPTIGID